MPNWDWIDLTIRDLGRYSTFADLSERFRNINPAGLVTPLRHLQGYVVLNLLAPRNTAFWTASRQATFNGVYNHLAESALDKTSKRNFLKDLRISDVKMSDPAIRMFDLYAGYFPGRSNKVPGYSKDGIATPESCRMVSTGCHVSLLPKLLRHLESEIEQFGSYAFFSIDDALTLGPPLDYSDLNISAHLFRLWQPTMKMDRDALVKKRRDILAQLEHAIFRAQSGESFDLPIEPLVILRPCPSFVLRGKESPEQWREIDDSDARKILSLRAHLIRTLEWPVFYDDVMRALTEKDSGFNRIDSYGIVEPFDVRGELEAYAAKMESSYPCLLEYPFETRPVSGPT